MKLDLVEFVYTFLIAPVFFIWMKGSMYFLLREELGVKLSTAEYLTIDTILSVLFLYVFSFVVMHSLTKSFNLMVADDDPFYDLFTHSEYFHLWLSHIGIILGGMLVFAVLASLNVWFPLPITSEQMPWWLIGGAGSLTGVLMYLGVLDTDARQEGAHFMRIMKLAFGIVFLAQVFLAMAMQVTFTAEHGFFWFSLNAFLIATALSFFTYRSRRARAMVQKAADVFKHPKWNFRAQLFSSKVAESVISKEKVT